MKLVITKAKIKQAALPKSAMVLGIDTTGLSWRELADALVSLAAEVESLANQDEDTETLRESMAIHGYETETRFPHRQPELMLVHDGEGREIGRARFTVKKPVEKVEEVEEVEEGVSVWDEDDLVEFKMRGDWQEGVVLDRVGDSEYLIEGGDGRHWQVDERRIRQVEPPTASSHWEW